MARPDDRLREDVERAARPADPSGLYEDLIRRRVQTGAVPTYVLSFLVGVVAILGYFLFAR